jgi:AraC-like DNA-binding protein
MTLELDLVSLFNIIGTINGLFITFIILGIKKGNKITNKIFAALIFSYSLIIFNTVFRQTRMYLIFPSLIGLIPHLYMVFGPMLYFYVKALTTPRFIFKKQYSIHFIPFILSFLFLTPFYFRTAESKINTYENLALHTSFAYHLLLVVRIIHLSIYLVLTFKLLKSHEKNIIETHSSLEKIKLDWIRYLILTLGLWLGAYLMFYIFSLKDYGTIDPCSTKERFFTVWQTLLLFFIGYKGLVQPEIFSQQNEGNAIEKYSHSTLSPKDAEIHLQTLNKYMKKEKPYLDSELTIKQLAQQLSISYLHLSQIINERLNKNFYNFINQYRVEEAKKKLLELKDNPHKTILDVAFDSGFNSKSSFNLVFKQSVKLTPSQYIKNKNQKS